MLDVKTMVAMLALVLLVSTAALGVTMRLNRSVSGIRHWFAGYGMLCLGLGLLAMQSILHPLVSIVLADSLIVGGYFTLWLGVRRFKGDSRKFNLPVLAGLGMLAPVLAYLSVIDPNPGVRIALVTGIIAMQLLLLAWEFWRGTGHAPVSARLTALVCAIQGLMHLGQAGALLAGVGLESVFQQSLFNQTLFLIGFNTSIMLALGLIVMTTERLQSDLREQAAVDPLTQLFNRRAFFESAARVLMRARHAEQPATLMLLDLDHFKAINDSFGHVCGDETLIHFAETLTGNLRPPDVLARLGGEEFVCLLPDTGLDASVHLAERLRVAVESAARRRDGPDYTVSIGLAFDPEADLDALIQKADAALYRAKRLGRNRVAAVGPGALEEPAGFASSAA